MLQSMSHNENHSEECVADRPSLLPRRANYFLDAVSTYSVKSINYACTVKNDTPIMCTVGVKVQMGFYP